MNTNMFNDLIRSIVRPVVEEVMNERVGAVCQPPFKPTLDDFCEAIKLYEGWTPGSRAYRNHNPGNCRFSGVGYLPIYEPVHKDDKGFAVFKDYETGWLYLKNLVKHKIEKNPSQTIFNFMSIYAPSTDGNDPTAYSTFIAKRLGVNTLSYQMVNLL